MKNVHTPLPRRIQGAHELWCMHMSLVSLVEQSVNFRSLAPVAKYLKLRYLLQDDQALLLLWRKEGRWLYETQEFVGWKGRKSCRDGNQLP